MINATTSIHEFDFKSEKEETSTTMSTFDTQINNDNDKNKTSECDNFNKDLESQLKFDAKCNDFDRTFNTNDTE
jgi:hypothetical protein